LVYIRQINLCPLQYRFLLCYARSFVTLENLRLVRDIAHFHSVSKAARAHGLSQSAASQALSELEKELGIEVFDRRRRPLDITVAGKIYLDYCREVLRKEEELKAALEQIKQHANGIVRVASIYSVGLSEMSQIEERFQERFPDAELQVQYLRPERVWQAILEDQADLGLMSYAESSREVVALPWRDEEMVVAVAPDNPLARYQSIPVSAVEGLPFVGFDDDLPIQEQIDRYLREYKVTVAITLRFDNIEMIKQAVSHGAGISIMPERVMREDMLQGRLMALRLEPAELYRPVRIVHRRRKVFNEIASGLLDLLREEEKTDAA
jgi:LysR family transcriptional regulator, transcriptional activator of the cysJI operon